MPDQSIRHAYTVSYIREPAGLSIRSLRTNNFRSLAAHFIRELQTTIFDTHVVLVGIDVAGKNILGV